MMVEIEDIKLINEHINHIYLLGNLLYSCYSLCDFKFLVFIPCYMETFNL
jgi:hypothetical protein